MLLLEKWVLWIKTMHKLEMNGPNTILEMLENSIWVASYGIIEILITKKETAEVFGYFHRDSLRWDDDEAIDLHIAYSSLPFEDIDTNEFFQTWNHCWWQIRFIW